jgi:hypothetical protein
MSSWRLENLSALPIQSHIHSHRRGLHFTLTSTNRGSLLEESGTTMIWYVQYTPIKMQQSLTLLLAQVQPNGSMTTVFASCHSFSNFNLHRLGLVVLPLSNNHGTLAVTPLSDQSLTRNKILLFNGTFLFE